ncbi:Crp/Fnr family transcriptional regulator [Acidisphaera rubrifaciens]|uniref:Transcriptional regulator Crp/Fnr n=1 Tax=Acidisphaera rubrifaciens HS-AP3 TaxID=1231350 RepID=A0A0D6P6I8_9PROT|nr:Crp/Fnr family transcriptional regulator [Acidisphaera rubrifaciens]GAN77380.1 transcriptional regulator Crp/Fnr [Acidisphaera rubrifaciens HS-AP3]
MPQGPENLLLASLVAGGWRLPESEMEAVPLPLGEPIHIRDGGGAGRITFVDEGVVSLVMHDEAGRPAEVGTVGREGLVGVPLLLGATVTPYTAFVQIAGRGRRVDYPTFRRWCEDDPAFRETISRYVYFRLLLSYQNTACNALHTAEQRVARWLLMTTRRTSPRFALKQDYLAMMLGVRRATVSVVCAGLKQQGLIDYSRGMVLVRDVPGLMRLSCSCFAAFDEFHRSLIAEAVPSPASPAVAL